MQPPAMQFRPQSVPVDLGGGRFRVQAGSVTLNTAMNADALGVVAPGSGTFAAPHQAASVSRRLAGWRPAGSGPNAVVSFSGPELVRRSRDIVRNNPHGKRAIGLFQTHVVGTGIKPRSLCPHVPTKHALMALWKRWVSVADADGTLDFYGLQALAVREMAEGGETFARLRTRRLSDGLPVPLQIQLLPSEQVPLTYSVTNGPNPVIQGIERDAIGRRVAYWCYPTHPYDWNGVGIVDLQPYPVPAADMVHLYNVSRIGQLRGLPWLAAAMTTLHQVNAYMDAELLRKQMVAAIVGFVRKVAGEDTTAQDVAAAYGTLTQQLGDLPSVALEPGTMQYLQAGEDVTFSNPADVGNTFEPFLAGNYRAVAAAAELMYEELTGDWSKTNDRTFRAQFNTFKRAVQQWQFSLAVAQFSQPIWDRFVDLAVASGAVRPPARLADADLRVVDWRPQRHDYIQPVQDINATGLEMGLGLISRSAAAAERGDDIEEIDAQIVADRAREASLGLALGGGISKNSNNPNLQAVDQSEGQDPGSTTSQRQADQQSQGGGQ